MIKNILFALVILACSFNILHNKEWHSKFVTVEKNGSLHYTADAKGNIIPDFSAVGFFRGDKEIPSVPIVKTINPNPDGNSEQIIQRAIDEVSKMDMAKNGFRGTILLKKGVYKIPGTIKINTSGIVLKGEGNDTKLIATGLGQRSLIAVPVRERNNP